MTNRVPQKLQAFFITVVFASVFIGLCPLRGANATTTCEYLDDGAVNHDYHALGPILRNYQVNWSSFSQIPDIDFMEGAAAAMLATDTWNAQTQAGFFRFGGYTNRFGDHVPHSYTQCVNEGLVLTMVSSRLCKWAPCSTLGLRRSALTSTASLPRL
ncbi:MAG: hypothetical protein CO108_21815 [Deltaproteobacteria bacterium CG_4_9_14_3_um_filter_63_12]|nr:MAG: hypothetical protein CO108_21815 [Deltaproteobacteria bacterium CG_4_9_14_3_um_filter_63_12]